jgi:hypothetical protein
MCLGAFPICSQLCAVYVPPLEKERNDSSRQFSCDFTGLDVYGPLRAGVPRVKMRRLMIAVVDGHDDAKESANDWHSPILNALAPCAYPRDWLLELTVYE